MPGSAIANYPDPKMVRRRALMNYCAHMWRQGQVEQIGEPLSAQEARTVSTVCEALYDVELGGGEPHSWYGWDCHV
jgi:hypothetical protein